MSEDRFERVVRAAFAAAAPADLPARLEERIGGIPLANRPLPWWLPEAVKRPASLLAAATALVVLIGVVGFVATWLQPSDVGQAANPVSITSDFGSLAASSFVVTIDGRHVAVPSPGDPGVQAFTFTGTATFGQLTVEWRAGDQPYVLVVHVAADARTWWVSDAVVTDGRAEQAGYLYFEGPAFETPRGATFDGRATLTSVRSTFGEGGVLGFGDLTLTAFAGQVGRDPSLATMPPNGVTGAGGPDYIPMVSGETIVGYVASHWQDDLPINSFRGLAPDEPVFGPDLRTIVGYSVPDQGFQRRS
jgi:hypothetical protein